MAIRRNDTRRRRVGVLSDEHATVPVAPVNVVASSKSSSKDPTSDVTVSEYSVSARRRHLAKTTDLIPKRIWSIAGVVLGLAVSIGLINLLFIYSTELATVLGGNALEAFSLTERGGLAQWLSSALLMLSGMVGFQVYALRRHRSNDYHGTYALWMWVSFGLLFASLSSAVGIHELFFAVVGYLTGSSLANGTVALVVVQLLVLSALAVRAIVEVRQSRVVVVGVGLTAASYAVACLIELPVFQQQVGESYELAAGNLMMAGNSLLLLTVFTYARFVYLRAQGILSEEAAAARVAAKQQAKEAKQQAKADRIATKEQARLDKLAEIEQEKADKLAAIEQAKADKIAAKEQAIADKEAAKADKLRAAEDAKTAKQLAKEQAKAAKEQIKADRKKKRTSQVETSEVTEEASAAEKAIETPLGLKLQTRKSKSKQKASQPEQTSVDQAESESESLIAQSPLGAKLSKSKQRKLRKQQKQQQQRRAA